MLKAYREKFGELDEITAATSWQIQTTIPARWVTAPSFNFPQDCYKGVVWAERSGPSFPFRVALQFHFFI
jgi:hypothetical protein